MRRARLAGGLVSGGVLLAYLLVLRHHYSSGPPGAAAARPLPQRQRSHRPGLQYGVMFDAGSTGTRVHVFKFQMKSRAAPSLQQETFSSIQPGLSSYADDPEKCSSGILALLDLARSSIPSSMWSRTPVVLKATAGLRLLPGDKAGQLLDTVRALFQKSPFMSTEDSVSIMTGQDEGISAWVTVNFLTGGLQGPGSGTVGILDLGGGSTQITFSPPDQKSVQMSNDVLLSFQMFNITHTVYTHSYLGLGLMSTRLDVLGGGHSAGGSRELVSPCLAPGYVGSWAHGEAVYRVRGQTAGTGTGTGTVYQACVSRVETVLDGTVRRTSPLDGLDFYAFSYYYDRAVDLRLVDEQLGGTVRVSDYTAAAQTVCSSLSSSPPVSPFLCLDLVYISVLLQQLGFLPDQQLKLARTIGDVETSWALGAALQYLQTLNPP
uniref:nucleoside diphosphate phosphatase n=1 Tax=Salarias fasciatus TaxID=181472 RepID=A0A672HYA2_SALFA